MRILFVITKSDVGGAQVFVLNLARSFKKLGYEVDVVAGDGDYLFQELKKNDIPFYYLNSLKRNFNIYNAVYFVFQLRNLLKLKNYDVVHLNSSNTLIGSISSLFMKTRPKMVFTFHGLSFIDKNFSPNFLIKYFAQLYFKFFLKAVDEVVFECQLNYEELMGSGMIKAGRIIHNGLDPNDLEFLSAKDARKYFSKECGVDLNDSFIIGSTGRLAYQKNYDFLIRNFQSIKMTIPNVKVIIIGDGPDREVYRRQLNELGIQNDFFLLGEIKNSHRFMNGFDVFTLTSRYEGVSISLIEAIYSDIPVLVSNVGGNPDVVGGDERQLFELNDFKDYLKKLLASRTNKDDIVQYNISLRHEFSLKVMTESYNELYLDN